jgi:flagellar hook protein FlgE
MEVVDSLGATHVLTVTFTKSGANTWDYVVSIPAADLAGASPTTNLANGSLTFDSQGQLTTPAASSPNVAIAVSGLANGAANMNINWSLYSPQGASLLTQFSQESATSAVSQNGIATAELTEVTLTGQGNLVARYSNGREELLAQLALAAIRNPDSLIAVGDNNFQTGGDTVTPAIGTAGSGGRGSILGGRLEASTVDIATEFTNLIVYQRGYQANSRVITTMNELSQETINLVR